MANAKKSTEIPKGVVKEVEVPLYDQTLIITNDFEKLLKHLARKYKIIWDYDPVGQAGFVTKFENPDTGASLIILCSINDLQTITHECVHAAWGVLETVGIEVSFENQEPLAYLTDWIFQATIKAFKLDGKGV